MSKIKRPTENKALKADYESGVVGNKPAKRPKTPNKKAWHRRQGVLDYNDPKTRAAIARRIALATGLGDAPILSADESRRIQEFTLSGRKLG